MATGCGQVLINSSLTAFLTVMRMCDSSAYKATVTSLIEGLQTELEHQHFNSATCQIIWEKIAEWSTFSCLDIAVSC